MRIGVDASTLSRCGFSPLSLVELAHEKGLSGVHFEDATQVDADLDTDALGAFRDRAELLGLGLSVGLPALSLWPRNGAPPLDSGDHARRLYRHLEAAVTLGCRHVRAYIGAFGERHRTDVSWSSQRAEAADLLRRLAPAAREMGLKFAIENNADQTSVEVLRMVESVGPEVAGVFLDIGDLPLTLDDPLRAVERLAPHVLAVHVKDAVLEFTPKGLIWHDRPIGSGVLPVLDMLGLIAPGRPGLDLFIDIRRHAHTLPIFHRPWLGRFPELHPSDLAAVVELAALSERRFQTGTLPRPDPLHHEVEGANAELDGLAQSVGFLRPMAELLERY
jgi:sugar phosphate isomerase/epimerase